MAVNTLLVLLGALSLAGVGLGAATFANMPFGGNDGGCPAGGSGRGGMMGYANGLCGPGDGDCDRDGDCNGTCDADHDGTCEMDQGYSGCHGDCGEEYGDSESHPCH